LRTSLQINYISVYRQLD